MKMNKVVCILLLIAVICTSFTGCELIVSFVDGDDTSPPVLLPNFCYSITTDSETYGYGAEIQITITLQLERAILSSIIDGDIGKVHFLLHGSENYEIIGESVFTFTEIVPEEYFCEDENGKRLTAQFKIKVNKPAYDTSLIKMSAWYESSDGVTVSEYSVNGTEILGLRFVADSHGIIVASLPYSAGHSEKYHESEINPIFWYDYRYISLRKTDPLLIKSYNREYAAGASADELIDRYLKMYLAVRDNKVECYLYHPTKGEIDSINYFSEDIRFKMYVYPDDEYIKPYLDDSNRKNLKTILFYALSKGVISEEEYEVEMIKMSDEKSRIFCGVVDNMIMMGGYSSSDYFHPGFIEGVNFEVPEGDNYFNYVVDIRNEK